MVKVFKHLHRYDDPPSTVLLAFYLRYPNPFARHVLSCDVLSRTVDPLTGTIKTQRLILKKGIVPRWATKWLEGFGLGLAGGGGLEAWVLEESEVWRDENTGMSCLKSMTRNISHKKLMDVSEGTELFAAHGVQPGVRGTYHRTTAHIQSNFGSGSGLSTILRRRIEDYGARRFEGNAQRAREGMSLILNLLRSYEPLPDTREAAELAGISANSAAPRTFRTSFERSEGDSISESWRRQSAETTTAHEEGKGRHNGGGSWFSAGKTEGAAAASSFKSTTTGLGTPSAAPASFFLSRRTQELLERQRGATTPAGTKKGRRRRSEIATERGDVASERET